MALNRTRQSNSESGSDVQATVSTKSVSSLRTGNATSTSKETQKSKKKSKQSSRATRAQTGTRTATTKRDGSTSQIQNASDNDSSVTTTVRPARVQISKQSATGTTQNAYDAVGLQISFSVPIVAGLDSAPST